MSQPRFSVIIPTAGRRSLQEAIESVQRQTIQDFELIIEEDPFRAGPAATRNRAVARARGEVLTFLDDDDLWLSNRLELAEYGLERARVAICHGTNRLGQWDGDVSATILDDFPPSLDGTAICREAFKPFDESFRGCEDTEWFLRIAQVERFATVPVHGFVVRNEGTGRDDDEQRLAGQMRLLEQYSAYFADHGQARRFRYERLGRLLLAAGRAKEARHSLVRALPRRSAVKPLARSIL